MATPSLLRVSKHTIPVAAPASVIYALIADVTRWPQIFAPTVHVDVLERSGGTERMRIWAFAHGRVHDWVSRRRLDPDAHRVAFRQEISAPPVASMGGEWVLTPQADGTTTVELDHDFRAVDDDPGDLDLIAQAVDRNSNVELTALRTAAELHAELDDLTVSFADTVLIPGSRAEVYDFLYRATAWPERLPHVARVELREDTPNVQMMEMDTRDPTGSVHTTSSVRLCFPDHRILYKQVSLPPSMSAHTGEWTLTDGDSGVTACSRHTVMFSRAAVSAFLGPDATVEDAKTAIRQALGANSRTTLQHAKSFIGGDRRD